MALADQYRSKLSEITSYDDRIAELTARKEAQYERVKKQAAVLTKARAAAAREVEKQLAERLVPLGMPNVRFQVEMGLKKEPGIQGEDTVTSCSPPTRTERCKAYLPLLPEVKSRV